MRVAYRCSCPDHDVVCVGPTTDGAGVVNVGVAAHMTAAAPGGPRYDATRSESERSSFANGIWLCQIHAKLIDDDEERFPIGVLKRWKAAAEYRAAREVGEPRLVGERADLHDFAAALRSATRLAKTKVGATVAHALLSSDNPYANVNDAILEVGSSLQDELQGWQYCHLNLRAVVEDLLADLSTYAVDQAGVYRFVTTHTSVERIGQGMWREEEACRTLVSRTASILANRDASFEMWRIFLLNSPAGIVERGELVTFLETLNENVSIHARVGVARAAAIGSVVPIEFDDFHCVPGRLAYVTVVPMYLLARFEIGKEDDRAVVSAYSEVAESLVDRVRSTADSSSFEWRGGARKDLEDRLLSIQGAD